MIKRIERPRKARLVLESLEPKRMLAFGTPLVDVPGIDTNRNPPDTVGDIGPNHYVQMVNPASYQVHDRNGAIVLASTPVDSLGTGVCATGRGDPVATYDHLADRWLLLEFAQRADQTLCIYVSQTPDPTGTYFEYQVATPNFPDYPKISLWNDAYFVGTNESDNSVYALPRQRMLNGPDDLSLPAIRRTTTDRPNWGRNHIMPADLDGPAAAAGSPGLFVRQVDDEITNPLGPPDPANDFLEIWEFDPDFATPASSTYGLVATVPISEFDYNLCLGTRDCLPQPGTTARIDALPHYIMWRAQYRNFGTHETLLVNFTVDVDATDHAGVRWVELRDSGAGWSTFQEGTVAPDGDHRWMGAISMNGKGDIALMYNVTGANTFPGVRYIGRLAADPLGTMPRGEFGLPGGAGTGSIDFRPCTDSNGDPTNANCQRWGDYSAMSVDPVDDTTFWFTGMYAEANISTDTRIAAVAFDEAPILSSLALSAASIDENGTVTLTGTVEDWNSLDDHTVTIDWKDGNVSVITLDADNVVTEMFMATHQYLDDHPLSGTASDNFNIMVTVTDSTGLSDAGSVQLTVNNVAPSIDVINLSASSIDEGQSVTVSGSFSDPALGAATESFDGMALWSDGVTTPVVVNSATGTFSTTRDFPDDHPNTGTPSDDFTVDITITDDDTGSDIEMSPVLTVNNVDPVIVDFASDATFEDKAEEGEPVNILADFTDVGILDTHVVDVDWGDGTPVEMATVNPGAPGTGTITGVHAYAAGGIYTITVTLTDDDTGTTMAQTTAVVTGVGLNNGILYIVGSNEDDHVSVNQTGKGIVKVNADFIPENFRTFDELAIDKIIAYLCAGDDHLTISSGVTLPAIIHGGKGDDHVNAGGGQTVLLGNEGNDRLVGQSGRNILIGGAGLDRLTGGNSDDVLIGGSTTADDDDDALMAIAIAWAADDTYTNRVAAVAALLAVIDDGDEDKLTGSSSQDLFYDGVDDILTDVKANETVI